MTISIWILIISAVLIISMMLYRHYEMVTGREVISNTRRENIDRVTLHKISQIQTWSNKVLRVVIRKITYFLDRGQIVLHDIWVKISTKIDKYFDRLRGRHGTGKRGIISLYWQEPKGRD